MPIRVLVFVLLSGFSLCSLNAAPKTERIDFYYGIAEGNYLVGDLGGAERGIEQMLRIDPNHLPALTLKARVLLDAGRPDAALEAADRAIELEPEKLEHTLLKALILGHMERRDDAGALIQEVLNQAAPASDDARAARQLQGLLLMAEGEWDRAAESFNAIYLADPETAGSSLRLRSEAYLEKARSAMAGGDPDAAIAAVDQAIEVYADQSGQESLQQRTALRLMRARLLAQIGRFEAAIQDLQILTGQQPENFEALITLASLYASVGRWESLEAVIEPIAQRPELRDVALYLEGRAALAKNRVGTARAKFEAAIEALPKEADLLRRSLYFYRGVCLQKLDRPDEAEHDLLLSLDAGFRPETAEEALIASRTLLRADRAAEAIPLLEAVTLNRLEPSAEVWAMLGRAHLATDTPALALSALNESLAIEPEQAEMLALRGSLLRKIGDLEGALGDYSRAHRLLPSSPVLSYERGLVLLQLGRIAEAETSLRIAARKLSTHITLDLLHASCAYTVGKYPEAAQSLREYLEPNLSGETLESHRENLSDTAAYLHILLFARSDLPLPDLPAMSKAARLFAAYGNGSASRKQVLDHAGLAETPEQARQQITAAAFWMAQWERAQGNEEARRELLDIALETGNADFTEYQLAKWQLEIMLSQ